MNALPRRNGARAKGRPLKARYPNILLIVMDATRAQNLSVYGYSRPTTPHLEAFAAECVVYENAIAASCWSLPCHASIFTGVYPSTHGADDQRQFLDAAHPIIGELLANRHGYRTYAFCSKRDVSPLTGMDRGFQHFDAGELRGSLRKWARKADNGLARVRGTHDSGLRHTRRSLQRLLPQLQQGDEPFFIFLSTVEAHIPYHPPRQYNHFVPDSIPARQVAHVNMDRWKYMANRIEMRPTDFEILNALYDAGIAYTDAAIGEILRALREQNLLDDMLVMITADHGENLGEHRLMAHGYCLYDTVIRVPLLIHYPKGISAAKRVPSQVQSVDILPTILNLLGDDVAREHPYLEGNDLLSSARHPFTVAEQANPDLRIFRTRFPDSDVSHYDRYLRMIRTERHKFIWGSDGRHELYDLCADPGENQNRIHVEPAVAEELNGWLQTWLANHSPAKIETAAYAAPQVAAPA